jgi:hypothetical protein
VGFASTPRSSSKIGAYYMDMEVFILFCFVYVYFFLCGRFERERERERQGEREEVLRKVAASAAERHINMKYEIHK